MDNNKEKIPNDLKENNKLDINFESVDRFTKILKVIIVGTITPIVLIGILVIVIALFLIKMYWYTDKESIIDHLEEIYSDKYEIISKNIDDEGNGYYKIAFKNNKEFIFNGYHKGNNTNIEDSQAYKLKYFFENLEDENLKQTFKPSENYYKINENDEQEFLKYELIIYVNSYQEFDEAVLNCYKLLEYCKEKRIYGYTILLNYNDYWSGFGQNDENIDYQILLNREKNNYIRYLINKNLNTKEIPDIDMQEIYRPENLKIILNGKVLSEDYQVKYNDILGEYEVKNFQKLVENIDSIEKVEYDRENVAKIKYNGKIYKLHYDNNELKKNSVPYVCRISYIEQLFNAKTEYNYIDKFIYINF